MLDMTVISISKILQKYTDMKTINYLIAILLISSFGVMTSCVDEIEGKSEGNSNTIQLTIAAPEDNVVSPTKSGGMTIDETINDICILIYKNGLLTDESVYTTDGISDIQNNASGHTYQIDIEDLEQRTVYVVANAGNIKNEWNNESGLNTEYSLANNKPKCILFAKGKSFNVKDDKSVTASLERIYAKVTVEINTKGVSNATITPKSVTLKNVPATGQLQENKIVGTTESVDYISNAGTITFADPINKVSGGHGDNADAFYMYENMQPLGYCLKDGKEFTGEWKSTYNGNQAYKTPASMGGATKDPAVVGRNKTCSYIEVVADYTGSKGNGTVNYRFFLGKDAYTSFAVERNTHYQETLTLSGDGGVDEASWRVTTAIMGAFTPHDAYVGYLVGSKSRVYVDLGNDTNLPNSNWTIRKKSGTDVVTTSSNLQRDGDRYYFEVVAKETNVSDRSTQSGVYTISSNKASESKDVTVTQVIRILDPIAYYHQNPQTVFEKDVVVKVFNRNPDNFYIPLSSVGAWTVSVESGNWFTLSKHQDYTGDNTVSADNNVITGEGGAVKFHFKASTLGNNSARYGCISVKYHNNMCEHKIYLRQGGGDTELISGQAQWAYSNVIKRGTNGTYATQPGPMFAGGNSSTLYNSYTPGYNISYDISGQDRSNWMTISGDHYSEPLQGPCPKGYTLPSIRDMSVLKKACHMDNLTAAVGYIYDDDPTPGWEWSQRNGVYYANPNNMDHSNPAKGIVLVNTNNYVNLVFPFGNGVLKHAGVPDNGMDTGLDEIGVGFRTSGKLYTEEDVMENGSINVYVSYNANYWSGSPGSGGNQHLSYMKFWYFLKRNVPIYLSDGSNRWGESWEVSWNGAGGLDRKNGMFVRCVKNSKPADRNYYSNNF